MKNTVKILLRFWYVCDISFNLTPILAQKIFFQREKYALQDGLKFNMIQWSDQ